MVDGSVCTVLANPLSLVVAVDRSVVQLARRRLLASLLVSILLLWRLTPVVLPYRPVFRFSCSIHSVLLLLLYWRLTPVIHSAWRLTPVVRIAGSTGLSALLTLIPAVGPSSYSCLLYFGIPRTHIVALNRTSSIKLHSGKALSSYYHFADHGGTPVVQHSAASSSSSSYLVSLVSMYHTDGFKSTVGPSLFDPDLLARSVRSFMDGHNGTVHSCVRFLFFL
jgi:hypothetical protein